MNERNISFGNDPKLQQLAFDLAFSTKLSAATIWNSFPWTWLIGYFSNVGRFLEVYRGGYPVKVSTISLMRYHRSSFTDVPSTSGPDLRYSGGYSTLETKGRFISYSPSAFLALAPGITSGQLANLASLVLAFMGRNPEVQRRTGVRPPSWYRKVTQAQNQVKAYGKTRIKLR
nr:MAG: hypothetical protein [Sanya steitz-like virus 5]